jgi:diaminopimelate epimerase
MKWPFSKYVGCGNDFILFDNREGLFPASDRSLLKKLCHRQWGIGADGLILLEHSLKADFRMRIFNADGSEAEMCGNGMRCLAQFLNEKGYQQSSYKIETMQRLLTVEQTIDGISVQMGNPTNMSWNIPLKIEDQECVIHFLNTGVPHTILFVENSGKIDLKKWGPLVRFHPLFAPEGTNFNLVELKSPNEILLRTYERGVEDETLACGTGATAAALATAFCYQRSGPLLVHTRSEETLTIGFQLKDGLFSHVSMTGPAHCTFRGEIEIKENLVSNHSFRLIGTERVL